MYEGFVVVSSGNGLGILVYIDGAGLHFVPDFW